MIPEDARSGRLRENTPPGGAARTQELNRAFRKAAGLTVSLRGVAREAAWLAERYRQLEPHREALGRALDGALTEAAAMREAAERILRAEL